MIAIIASAIGILATGLSLFAKPKAIGLAFISLAFTACSLVYVFELSVQHNLVEAAMLICLALVFLLIIKNTRNVQAMVAMFAVLATTVLLSAGALVGAQPVVLTVSENGKTGKYELTGQLDENQVKTISKNIRLASSSVNNERKIIFWANFAPEGSNNMGPEMHFESLEDAIARQSEKMETDPLWFANKVEGLVNGSKVDPQKVDQRAKYYIQNPNVWDEHIARVYESFGPAYEADFGSTRYESQGMYPGKTKDDMPTVTKFSVLPEMGKVLVQTYKPGYWSVRSEIMREACDLQPSNTVGFPNIPEPHTPEKRVTTPPSTYVPPTTTTTPPPVTTTTTPPPVTTTTTPPPVTTTTTPPPVTTTTTPPHECPPQYPNCKDPNAGPNAPEGHTTAEAPTEEPEETLTPEPKPVNPTVAEEAPIPAQDEVVAPDATPPSTEEREKVEEETPPVTEIAPQPEQPGTSIVDPDAAPVVEQTTQSDSDDTEVSNQENHKAEAPSEAPETEVSSEMPEAEVNDVKLTPMSQPEKAGFAGNGLMGAMTGLLSIAMVRRLSKKMS